MIPVETREFPEEQERAYRKARRLEWVTVGYIASAALFLYLVKGSSQAMRTSWLEDMVSLVPPIAFLVCSRLAVKPPSEKYPYGTHSAVSIGYLTASLALLAMGLFLLIEAAIKLYTAERTTIGGMTLFGETIWAGWPMLVALTYTGVPSIFLGRMKLKLAPIFHDKVLYADAEMNRADWMAELAAAIGVIGTGFGLWWMDASAAGIVSLAIIRDGWRNLGAAVTDLIDETPKRTVDRSELEPLPRELARHLERTLDWVETAEVRMREEGHVFFGEVFIIPRAPGTLSGDELVSSISQVRKSAKAFNWRIHDLTVMPVDRDMLDRSGSITPRQVGPGP